MASSKLAKGWNQSFVDINLSDQDVPVAAASGLKAGINSLYESQAGWSTKGELWNWGLCDQGVAEDIEDLIPGFSRFDTDTFSEQLYMLTVRELPLSYEDYATRQVLEGGSGLGEGLNFLSRAIGPRRMVGVDLSQNAVDRANSSLSRRDTLSFVHGDAENLPFEEGEFDVVINVESSHSYPNLKRFIEEVARVLKPGGYFSHVDFLTDQRLAEFRRIKAESTAFDWLEERDISENVRTAIRRRMVRGSAYRRMYAEKKKRLPFGIRRAAGPGGTWICGADFVRDRGSVLYRTSSKLYRRPAPVRDTTFCLTTARKLEISGS